MKSIGTIMTELADAPVIDKRSGECNILALCANRQSLSTLNQSEEEKE